MPGINDEQDAAGFFSYPQTAQGRRHKELPAEALPGHANVTGDTREFEAGDVVPGQPQVMVAGTSSTAGGVMDYSRVQKRWPRTRLRRNHRASRLRSRHDNHWVTVPPICKPL
ncbi:MAG: hypothetical protein U0Z70_13730 [Thermomicrobiales bacterium]|nr:hypothetical protein [Chloroflexia bacterium]